MYSNTIIKSNENEFKMLVLYIKKSDGLMDYTFKGFIIEINKLTVLNANTMAWMLTPTIVFSLSLQP